MKTKITTRLAVFAAVGISLTGCKLEDYLINKIEQIDRSDVEYVASGVISDLDNMTVNGIDFSTSNAEVTVDDQSANTNDLDVGMYVTIEGSLNDDGSGQASRIIFENEIEGMVLANNVAVDGTLDVMGQTVKVDANTRFRSELLLVSSPADIQANQFVEVSGYATGNGEVYATRIDVKGDSFLAGSEYEIKGVVTQLTDSQFQIGSLTVDYSSARLEDFNRQGLSEGLYVEVKSVEQLDGLNFVAYEVELETESHSSQHSAEIEGIVTDVQSDTFKLNGVTVHFDGNTYFKDGNANQLSAGTKVEVEGNYDDQGRLIANEVEFEDNDSDDDRYESEDDNDDDDNDRDSDDD